MSTQLEKDLFSSFDDSELQHRLPEYYRAILRGFRKVASQFVSLNLSFLALLGAEIFSILFFFSFLSKSSLLVVSSLSAIVLTIFTYAILLFYLQAKKPEELLLLRDKFLSSCKNFLSLPAGEVEHHLSLAGALSKLAVYLQDFESNFYKIPSFLQLLSPWINGFSRSVYAGDVFQMKELLLTAAIGEHLKQIRITPTDLETHASLASAYVAFSTLYKNPPKKKELYEPLFRRYAELAIEEFKILHHYAPSDPWVHEKLAEGYKELEMPEDEIREIELLRGLRPQDKEVLFRLGALYFAQGQNAKGLQVYEELKLSHYKKGEMLIARYGDVEKG